MSGQLTIFTWDPVKARANERKHGVGFDEASSVFLDDQALLIPDPANDEERFLLLGASAQCRLLVVCHCYREQEHVIRIIPARKATQRETGQYLGAKVSDKKIRRRDKEDDRP